MTRVSLEADALYERLREAGFDVLYDDREESPGVKFADADLIGVPLQVIVGRRGLAHSIVEVKLRADGVKHEVGLEHLPRHLRTLSAAKDNTLKTSPSGVT